AELVDLVVAGQPPPQERQHLGDRVGVLAVAGVGRRRADRDDLRPVLLAGNAHQRLPPNGPPNGRSPRERRKSSNAAAVVNFGRQPSSDSSAPVSTTRP